MAKRLFDFVLATLGLVTALPLMILIAVTIRLTSQGPALFKQMRVGRHGQPFQILKFRTMAIDTPERATHEVPTSYVTDVGRLLRRTKLDELPQLLNVALGHMSLVGPRPCLPSQRALIEARARRGVAGVRPGITGLAQVLGVDMSRPEVLANLDGAYARRRTFCGDLRLLLTTFGVVSRPKISR